MAASLFIWLSISAISGRALAALVKRVPAGPDVGADPMLSGKTLHSGPWTELAAVLLALWASLTVPDALIPVSLALGLCLLALALLDLRHFWLPDALTLPLMLAGLVYTALIAPPAELTGHVLGALLGWGALVVIARAFRKLRGVEGLGFGDAKLFGAAGAWIGYEGLPGILLISAATALGAAVLANHRVVPFGPFIAFGFWLSWLYGPLLI